MLVFGRVRYFDAKPKRQCGEVTVLDERDQLTDETVAFLRSRLHVVRFDRPWENQPAAPSRGPWWRGPIHGQPTRNRQSRSARQPRRYDLVVLQVATCGGVKMAERWAFVDKHQRQAYDELHARGLVVAGLGK